MCVVQFDGLHTAPCRLSEDIARFFYKILGHVTSFYVNRCYGNQEKYVF